MKIYLTLKYPLGFALVLWLDQRHALKAFRAPVGDEEGHDKPLIYWP